MGTASLPSPSWGTHDFALLPFSCLSNPSPPCQQAESATATPLELPLHSCPASSTLPPFFPLRHILEMLSHELKYQRTWLKARLLHPANSHSAHPFPKDCWRNPLPIAQLPHQQTSTRTLQHTASSAPKKLRPTLRGGECCVGSPEAAPKRPTPSQEALSPPWLHNPTSGDREDVVTAGFLRDVQLPLGISIKL